MTLRRRARSCRPALFALVLVVVAGGCSSPNPLKPGADSSAGSGQGSATGDGDVTVTTGTGGTGSTVIGVEVAPADTVPPAPFEGFRTVRVRITMPDGTVREWCLLLADTDERRSRGLMDVTDLAGYPGMAFSWGGREVSAAFYMFRTRIPLSIGYVAADGTFLGANDMEPCTASSASDCPVYPPPAPFATAVEVPRGGLGDLGLVPGARLEVLGPGCRP